MSFLQFSLHIIVIKILNSRLLVCSGLLVGRLRRAATPKSDIWSLGVIVLWIHLGKIPFAKEGEARRSVHHDKISQSQHQNQKRRSSKKTDTCHTPGCLQYCHPVLHVNSRGNRSAICHVLQTSYHLIRSCLDNNINTSSASSH